MSEPRLVQLRVHSDYSTRDGLAKNEHLVNKATA